MAKEVADFQKSYVTFVFVQETGDWRKSYLEFFHYDLLSLNRSEGMMTQRKSSRFFVGIGVLFRRGFDQAPFRCISGDEVARVLKEVYVRDYGEHQWGSRLFDRLFILAIFGL